MEESGKNQISKKALFEPRVRHCEKVGCEEINPNPRNPFAFKKDTSLSYKPPAFLSRIGEWVRLVLCTKKRVPSLGSGREEEGEGLGVYEVRIELSKLFRIFKKVHHWDSLSHSSVVPRLISIEILEILEFLLLHGVLFPATWGEETPNVLQHLGQHSTHYIINLHWF